MKMQRTLLTTLFSILLSFQLFAQPAPNVHILTPQEPTPNLGQLKTRLVAYHDCTRSHGCYVADVNRQSDLAIAFLKHRVAKAAPGEKLALVLDIDETSLSNWAEAKQDDFGYIADDWNRWVEKAQAPAIPGTLRLYNEAVKRGVAVFFITGRPTTQESSTTASLKAAGYQGWAGLAVRDEHPPTQTVAEYKSGERGKIVAAGYHIILNVGDQFSDLSGRPKAELSVKLPNPFYYVP